MLTTKLCALNFLKIAKRMTKNNQGNIGEQWIRNDDGVMAASNEDKWIAWKRHHEKLLKNTEFTWDRNSLSQVDPVSIVPLLKHNNLVMEPISRIKDGKAAGPYY